jgi:hypothetical protein
MYRVERASIDSHSIVCHRLIPISPRVALSDSVLWRRTIASMSEPNPSRRSRPHQRRAFTPPPARAARKPRKARSWPESDWITRIPPALVRSGVALGFASLAAFEERFGGLAVPVLCFGLASACVLAVYLMRTFEIDTAWPLPAVDAVTVVMLVPVVVVASGIEVADARLGGEVMNFAAAATAVVATVCIVALLASWLTARVRELAPLAFLPAALVVAAIIAGAERFAADALAAGLSMAWMAAAVATLLDGIGGKRMRPLLPAATFALFAIAVALLGRSGTTAYVTSTNTAIALIVTALAGAALLLLPAITAIDVSGSREDDAQPR